MKRTLPLLFALLLASCGDDKVPHRGNQVGDPGPQRGWPIEKFTLRATFTSEPKIEYRDFGGAVLTMLTVPLTIQEGDPQVMDDVFWESARSMKILVPETKGCVPSLFGIDPKRGEYLLKFWGWDNVGHSTACEEFIDSIPTQGFAVELTDVRWADIGIVNHFEAYLTPKKP